MAQSTEAKQVESDGSVSNRRFDARDFNTIEEFVCDEYSARLGRRTDTEKQWKEIDRQVKMEPEIAYKRMPNGSVDTNRNWMAEVELPLQAQALEVLTADARRFMFPDEGLFFKANAETTDEYLQKVNFQSLVMGDQTEVPSKINQDNANKLVEGFLAHQFNQYDFMTRIDKINAEAFKYGCGIGRGRMETKNVFIDDARGHVIKQTQRVPVMVPCSIKHLYLDDTEPSMHSATPLAPSHIWRDYMKFSALAMAASKGSSDPYSEDGGWMPKNLKKIEPDKDGMVTLLEMEGDIVLPRKTVRSMVIPNAIVTVAMGGKAVGGQGSRALVRLRFRKSPVSSYFLFPYHYEGAEQVYPTSPLMKGRPVQAAASAAVNRTLDSAMLKIGCPTGYDRTDPFFAANGGAVIAPFQQWPTTDPAAIKVFSEIGGDPAAMAALATQFINLYAELTGVLPARLGAQTNSHTTAFAKDAELQRGATRTVDYVNQVGNGAMIKWLDFAYKASRDAIKGTAAYYIASYGGWVEVTKDQLPENSTFEWKGAGGPQDENQKQQALVNSAMLALKVDALNVQLGRPPRIDASNLVDEILRRGGWTDLDSITNHQAAIAGPPQGVGVAALQNLSMQPVQ